MSTIITIEIDQIGYGEQANKEAIAMDLEKYGEHVRVVSVVQKTPEQTKIHGFSPARFGREVTRDD